MAMESAKDPNIAATPVNEMPINTKLTQNNQTKQDDHNNDENNMTNEKAQVTKIG